MHLRDPLKATDPGQGLLHPASYWAATAGGPVADDGPAGDETVDVAVIGGGYTGLSTAFHLASRHHLEAVVLEANLPGWGCSGRNGSFARPVIGRLPYRLWIKRWGLDISRELFHEALTALQTVRDLIEEGSIDCDVQPEGYLKLAHQPRLVKSLQDEQALLRKAFRHEVEYLDKETVAQEYFRGGEAHAALRWRGAFTMHPLKLANGLVSMARLAGARVHSSSPVTDWMKEGDLHILQTPSGTVRARHVVVASNGYTIEKLFPDFARRLLPVTSNIVVTQPMSPDEIAEGNFITGDAMSDTRTLLYYYRRLPDNRIMLGGKGPVSPHAESLASHRDHLLKVVHRKFPFFREPRADFFWGGWVGLTWDDIPHVGFLERDPSVFYGLGFMGSGVSFTLHCGRRIADAVVSGFIKLPAPIKRPLPPFPMAGFRRWGQSAVMRYHALRDER